LPLVEPGAIVVHRDFQRAAGAARAYREGPGAGAPGDAMADRVLDQVLQRETRDRGGAQLRLDGEDRAQAIRETLLLDGEILAHQLELFVEAHLVGPMARQRTPQHLA